MKFKFYSKIIICVLAIFNSNISFAYQINVSTMDYTEVQGYDLRPPHFCSFYDESCISIYNSGSKSSVYSFFDPTGKKKFKFYLSDSGNWSLDAHFGDYTEDFNTELKISRKGQIQLHGLFPEVFLYSNSSGVFIKDQDDKIIELATWGVPEFQ